MNLTDWLLVVCAAIIGSVLAASIHLRLNPIRLLRDILGK